MKRKTIFTAFWLAATFISGNLSAQTQAELHEQAKSLTEVKDYITNASFEDATLDPWQNNGFQGQGNTAFVEKTGSKYCEKWVADGNNIADASIYQTCALPNGQYTLAIEAKATQRDQGGLAGFYFVACDGDWDLTKLTREPITGPVNFTIEEDGSTKNIITYYIPVTIKSGHLTVGLLSESCTANYVRFDNVRILTSDLVPIYQIEIGKKLAELEGMLGELPEGYRTLLFGGDNPLYNSASDLADSSTDKEELSTMVDSLSAVLGRAKIGKELFQNLSDGLVEASVLLETDYPGRTEFQKVIDDATEVMGDPNALNPEFIAGIATLKAGFKAYKLTSIGVATESQPVDVTFLIDTPNFTKDPDFGEGDIADKTTLYKGAWATHNVYSPAFTDNDSKLNYCSNKNCWNNWSRSFYSLDLYQTLGNMPEGVYSLEMLTSSSTLGNARGYARTTNGVVYSPVHTLLTPAGIFADVAEWEELTTNKIYVAANDTLQIGMFSTNTDGNNTSGWFCATEFRLFYYGKGNANKQILEMKLAEIKILDVEETMTQKALEDLRAVIAKAQNLYDSGTFEGETYTAVLEEVNNMIPLTQNRVTVYAKFQKKDAEITEFVNRGESECCDLIAAVQEAYTQKIQENADIDVAEFEQYTTELDQYLTFANSYMVYEAYAYNEEFDKTYLQKYAEELYAILEYVDANGVSSLPEAGQKLEKALQLLFSNVIKVGDITHLIKNPSFEENTGGAPSGWTNKGFNIANNKNFKLNNNPAYTGENFCEQWVAAPKALGNIQIYQTNRLPNGKYTISVDAMAFQQDNLNIPSIVGFYVVAKDGAWEDGSNLVKEQILYPYKEITAEGDTIISYSINLEVTKGQLTIGMITETTNANWIMCDNFQVMLNELSPISGIENVYDGSSTEVMPVYTEGRRIIAPEGATIYNISGLPVAQSTELMPGTYFVRIGEKTYKIQVH